jgi:hypothetical protein
MTSVGCDREKWRASETSEPPRPDTKRPGATGRNEAILTVS